MLALTVVMGEGHTGDMKTEAVEDPEEADTNSRIHEDFLDVLMSNAGPPALPSKLAFECLNCKRALKKRLKLNFSISLLAVPTPTSL
jgi:hypothetical protein